MLPISRDETCTPSSPVRSALLNSIQDCIVGAKYGPIEIPMPAGAWNASPSANASHNGHVWTFTGAAILYGAIPLPVGAVIDEVTFAYNRNGAGAITLRLKKIALLTAGVVSPLSETVISSGTGHATTTITPDYMIEPGYGAWLEIECNNAANLAWGAVVRAHKP